MLPRNVSKLFYTKFGNLAEFLMLLSIKPKTYNIMNKDLEIRDNQFLRQFETEIQDELVKVEYAEQDRKIFLTKLVMSDKLRADGYLDLFVSNILEIARERNLRVVPTSPAVAGHMKKHRRKYKDLLPVGINI